MEVHARDEERQKELDRRLIPNIPSWYQFAYLAGLVAGRARLAGGQPVVRARLAAGAARPSTARLWAIAPRRACACWPICWCSCRSPAFRRLIGFFHAAALGLGDAARARGALAVRPCARRSACRLRAPAALALCGPGAVTWRPTQSGPTIRTRQAHPWRHSFSRTPPSLSTTPAPVTPSGRPHARHRQGAGARGLQQPATRRGAAARGRRGADPARAPEGASGKNARHRDGPARASRATSTAIPSCPPARWEASLRAVGAGLAAVDAVIEGKAANAFCQVRPPGHHAEADRAMGFCLFSNAAIAGALCARQARRRAHRHRRFRRSPRQRHAGYLLVRQELVLRLDARDAAVSRHRRDGRARRRQYPQRAPARRRWRRAVPRGGRIAHSAGLA